jgi:catechol 2,3-dioxygenase-like lactoylglutathione lyase family enzyme
MRPEHRPLAFDLVNEDGRRMRFQRAGDDITVHILGATGDRHMTVDEAKALVERLENRGFRRTGDPGEIDDATFFGVPRATAPRLRPEGITLGVRDVPALTTFYHTHLGLEIVERGPERAQLRAGTFVLYLEKAREGEALTPSTMATCRTDDIRADLARLRQVGVRLLGDQPRETGWGLEAVFADPEGNRWRLLERKG